DPSKWPDDSESGPHAATRCRVENLAMDQLAHNAGGPPAQPNPKNRRRLILAGGGTIALLVAAAALMQVWRSDEGVAAEAGQARVGQAPVAEGAAARPRYLGKVGDAVITYEQVAEEAMARHGAE